MIRNINRVDHVAGLVRPENMESTIERMTEVLQTSFYGPFERPEAGFRVAVSIDSGIELIAPLTSDPANPLTKMLEERGEHWLSVVFGVRDLDVTCDHLARMGYKPQRRGSILRGGEPYAGRIARMEQASFDSELFHGLSLVFSYTEEREGEA